MDSQKFKEIHDFCLNSTNPANIARFSRYFKDGFEGYGIDQKSFEGQRDLWIENWKHEMNLEKYLDLADELVLKGKYEELSFAMAFVQTERKNYTPRVFDRVGKWLDTSISNWANCDVFCMLVLSSFLIDKVIDFNKLKEWTQSPSQWKRRAVPVTLNELVKLNLKPEDAIFTIEPLMTDNSEYVQKGIGTLLRGLWKKYPHEIENFLLIWKDSCGRLIIQYATEKMEKEKRQLFKRSK